MELGLLIKISTQRISPADRTPSFCVCTCTLLGADLIVKLDKKNLLFFNNVCPFVNSLKLYKSCCPSLFLLKRIDSVFSNHNFDRENEREFWNKKKRLFFTFFSFVLSNSYNPRMIKFDAVGKTTSNLKRKREIIYRLSF